MHACRRFLALNSGERWVAGEAVALLLFVRATLSTLSFHTLRTLLKWYSSRNDGRHRRSSDATAQRIARIVTGVATRLPIGTTCLVEALVAETMLRRRGYGARLRLGVQRPDEGPSALAAHAWVECEGAVLIGELDGLRDYAVLSVSRAE